MSIIRDYVTKNLMDPLRYYPTAIQDTMTTIIADRLEELYELTLKFPEITTPTAERLDILKVIADQFLFNIRDDAELQEQIDILDNILYVYNKRGSIDTIENMWKYYGGKLPKDVKIRIPAYNLFTWNISDYDGTHVFPDNTLNKPGVFEVILKDNIYPIEDLKAFMIDEFVNAGTTFYFKNLIHFDLLDGVLPDSNPFYYKVQSDVAKHFFSIVLPYYHALRYSGNPTAALSGRPLQGFPAHPTPADIKKFYSKINTDDIHAKWSGKANIWIDLTHWLFVDTVKYDRFIINPIESWNLPTFTVPHMRYIVNLQETYLDIFEEVYSTPEDNTVYIKRNLINREDEVFVQRDYFILDGVSILDIINYEKVEE